MKIVIGEQEELQELTKLGGRDQAGNCYGVNQKYLTRNGRPLLPVMGEFHFSRWTPEEWEESLRKMKAGGVDIVATYVFWIHHEEKKGEWDFTGCRDLRAFLTVCQKLGMPVWLRIGPWAHGECRNGGFPDWLVAELGHNGLSAVSNGQAQVHEARTNDTLYLDYVREFWGQIAEQTKGMMVKDGGPVLGVQLENEYCHAGGPVDKQKGVAHMRLLKQMALEYDFTVPYYTATGWGGAIVLDGETLPVMGGYVDAPWAGHTKEMPACENFLIMPFREDENIGADLAVKKEADTQEYMFSRSTNPYLTAELGGGLQVTGLRRTYPFPADIEAQALCMLGAGANLLGYYMYHGGFNPDGKLSTLQESRETGYFNELPVKSYDFQTCIRESGQLHESYHRLKRLHLMIHSFEEILAPAVAYFPDIQPNGAEDMTTPRISVRYHHETGQGFLIINNHQRLRRMSPIEGLTLELSGAHQLRLRDVVCDSGETAVIPFGLQMGESRLLATNASLLCKVGTRYFFYHNWESDPDRTYFEYEGQPYDNVVVLSRQEAEAAWVFDGRLYLTKCPLLELEDGNVAMLMQCDCADLEEEDAYENTYYEDTYIEEKLTVYEEFGEPMQLYLMPPENMTHVSVQTREVEYTQERRVYEITVNRKKEQEAQPDELHELYLKMRFAGDRACLYEGDHLLTDWFANGEDWSVALKRYGYPTKLQLVIYPYQEEVYYDLTRRPGCELIQVSAQTQYQVLV